MVYHRRARPAEVNDEAVFPGKRITQGRCFTHNIRFVWAGKPLLRDAYCPRCGAKLQQTTHFFKSGPTEYVHDKSTLSKKGGV